MGKKAEPCPPEKNTEGKNLEKWWIRGSSEICNFFGISAQTLSNWVKKGCPQEGYGTYDLQKMIRWKYEEDESSAFVRKIKAEADWKEAKAAQEAIKLAVTEGQYISVEEVTRDLRRLFTVLKRSLMAIGHDIATEINAFDPDVALAAKKVVDDAVHNALNQLTEKGEYMQRKK